MAQDLSQLSRKLSEIMDQTLRNDASFYTFYTTSK